MLSTTEFLMASHNHQGGVDKRGSSSLRVIRVRGKTIGTPVGCVAAPPRHPRRKSLIRVDMQSVLGPGRQSEFQSTSVSGTMGSHWMRAAPRTVPVA